ncbi:hypothetical protein BS47DRAFT_379154 [Hydnum rufescens UP504]|uniref:SAP domain-containing protein n=1 Tax=Hydnum rufescens UP504 TaxID=1448309 RepID=A0A9P6AK77_9AGAM|nr:hypothetical protein BS47DRAFT_379154 [Hydnum rufescens UP504]
MSSENILQNSPALHSLKRAQLVRLCRNHGLKFKATEKNIDLIRRLQEYGRNPPRRSGSDDESEDDEEPGMDTDPQPAPRPSEAWSLVDEPSVEFTPRFSSTLPTIQEFGGSDSIKCAHTFISAEQILSKDLPSPQPLLVSVLRSRRLRIHCSTRDPRRPKPRSPTQWNPAFQHQMSQKMTPLLNTPRIQNQN